MGCETVRCRHSHRLCPGARRRRLPCSHPAWRLRALPGSEPSGAPAEVVVGDEGSVTDDTELGLVLPTRLSQRRTGISDQMRTVQIRIISSENTRVFSPEITCDFEADQHIMWQHRRGSRWDVTGHGRSVSRAVLRLGSPRSPWGIRVRLPARAALPPPPRALAGLDGAPGGDTSPCAHHAGERGWHSATARTGLRPAPQRKTEEMCTHTRGTEAQLP